jgi:hypothetical protein
MTRGHVKEQGLAERPAAASGLSKGSLSAPRARRYLEPLPLAYRLFRGQRMSCRQRWTRAFQPRRGADERLRWSVTPAAWARATLSQMRPTRLRGSPRAPHPSPRGRTVSVTHPSQGRDEASVREARRAGLSGERPTAESWRCQPSANSGHSENISRQRVRFERAAGAGTRQKRVRLPAGGFGYLSSVSLYFSTTSSAGLAAHPKSAPTWRSSCGSISML